jgi:signal transduction histidine kinase
MGRLVADLLDSSALDSGVLRLQSDWCDLALVIEAAVACLPEPRAVEVQIPAEVPPVWGDHDRLEQVLVNLLENAARHGEGAAGIVVEVESSPLEVTIRVRDRGPGIPAELREVVFQPAVRGASPAGGQGLGLTIARGIVEAHAGSIVVEPTAIGATLRVTLPVEPVDARV